MADPEPSGKVRQNAREQQQPPEPNRPIIISTLPHQHHAEGAAEKRHRIERDHRDHRRCGLEQTKGEPAVAHIGKLDSKPVARDGLERNRPKFCLDRRGAKSKCQCPGANLSLEPVDGRDANKRGLRVEFRTLVKKDHKRSDRERSDVRLETGR